jgi:beta-phosphoglucomutase-like phosphatase (HAD superfamily)
VTEQIDYAGRFLSSVLSFRHPDPYLDALHALGIAAHEALVFEDSPSGVAAAVAAGIPVVALATSQAAPRLFEAGATLVIDDFRAILPAVHAAQTGSSAGPG